VVRVFAVLLFVVQVWADSLDDKIKSLVEPAQYEKHFRLIKRLFADRSEFYTQGERVDILKVVRRLKENGLLPLEFAGSKKSMIVLRTSSSPMLALKCVDGVLRELGYVDYLIERMRYDLSELSWSISFVSDYTLDPETFASTLIERGCFIADIKRELSTSWIYEIECDGAVLPSIELSKGEERKLKKPLDDYWLRIKEGKKIRIYSYGANSWHPKISFLDRQLNVLSIYRENEKRSKVSLDLPQGTYYIKISDIFTLSNIKYGLKVSLE